MNPQATIILNRITAKLIGLQQFKYKLFVGVIKADMIEWSNEQSQSQAVVTPQPRVLYDQDRETVRTVLHESIEKRKIVKRNYKRASGEPTLKELRACALAYVCNQLDNRIKNVSISAALDILYSISSNNPDLYASQWYIHHAANESQWQLFKGEWKSLGGSTRELS